MVIFGIMQGEDISDFLTVSLQICISDLAPGFGSFAHKETTEY